MAEVHTGNTRRKIRALLAKAAPTSGCTPAESASAMKMARDIANKHLPSNDAVIAEIDAVGAQRQQAELDASRDKAAKQDATFKETIKTAEAKAEAKKTGKGGKPKKVTRAETIITMMKRKEGVSIAELQAIFKTEAHTVRAQISVESRKAGIKPVLKDGRYYKTAPTA